MIVAHIVAALAAILPFVDASPLVPAFQHGRLGHAPPTTSHQTLAASLPVITPPTKAPSPVESTLRHQARRQAADIDGAVVQLCPTTYIVLPPQTAGSTSTVYRSTATQTMLVPCGGCQLEVSTALAGYGPVGKFTTTVTAPLGYETIYRCS